MNDDCPRHCKRRPKPRQKRWGIEQWIEWSWSKKPGEWGFARWYASEKARDQAFENVVEKCDILRQVGRPAKFRKIQR